MKPAILLLFAIGIASAQTKPAASAPTVDKPKVEAYLRHLELWIPQVTVKIDDPKPAADMPGFNTLLVHLSYNASSTDLKYYISNDGTKIFKGESFDLSKSPFQANIDKLSTKDAPSFGDPKAAVTLHVFGDFQCPYCKEEAQILRNNLKTTFPDKTLVYFHDFPLESLHPWAKGAAVVGRCVLKQGQDAFWKYHDWVYEHQQELNPESFNGKIQEFLSQSGADAIQLGRCMDAKATEPEVAKSLAEGRSLGVDQTPTLFLNGRKLTDNMTQWQILQQLLTMELDHQAKVAADAEACCTVKIPMLGGK